MSYGVVNTDLITTSDGVSSAGVYGLKNRIFNGDMRIDQRNAGASVATNGTNTFSVDRWKLGYSQNTKFTIQQNANSVTPPSGFTNYIGAVSTSAYTVGSGETFGFVQSIEGLNIADLAWGTASAATVTLSFWVYSSLTGTFGGSLRNSAVNYSYPFSYTISSANTWEQKTITIAGPTSGTWLTTNGVGVGLFFSLGTGSTFSGTAGSWAAANYISATGATSVVGTNGATFYITGVQLEKGSTATSFDYLDYGRSLMQCQRYYYKTFPQGTVPAQNTGSIAGALLISTSATSTFGGSISLPVTMRSAPSTVTTYNPYAANASWRDTNNSADRTVGSASGGDSSLYITGLSGIVNGLNLIHVTATAEL